MFFGKLIISNQKPELIQINLDIAATIVLNLNFLSYYSYSTVSSAVTPPYDNFKVVGYALEPVPVI